MITHLGEYPSLAIGPLLDTHRTDIGTILRESLEAEARALALYRKLQTVVVESKSVMLEEYARQMVQAEELHAGEVDKMLRQPGAFAAFRPEAGQPVLLTRRKLGRHSYCTFAAPTGCMPQLVRSFFQAPAVAYITDW
jgi:hypothetical protein